VHLSVCQFVFILHFHIEQVTSKYYKQNLQQQISNCLETIITILVNIRRLVYYLKHDVLETGFSTRIQVEPNLLGPAES
jgi:hypothetical protein